MSAIQRFHCIKDSLESSPIYRKVRQYTGKFVNIQESSSVYCILSFFPSDVLKNVSAIRYENMLQDFLSDEVPSRDLHGYHEKCYQEYTNKQKLNRIAEKRKKERYENEALCKKFNNFNSLTSIWWRFSLLSEEQKKKWVHLLLMNAY